MCVFENVNQSVDSVILSTFFLYSSGTATMDLGRNPFIF